MEVAGAKEMPEDAERKGLGTPATRAAILEKLVATGFVERKKSKKTVSLIPTHAGISLITVLPEQLQSPLMTAEWEHRLKEIERGEESPETFMQGIRGMVCELVKTYKTVLGADVLFPSGRAVVGKCPRCGSDVTESKKGYFCERNDCHFGLWRDNRFLAAKKINLTKKLAETLLKDGKTYASGIFSEKTGKTYDAYIVLEDDGQRSAQLTGWNLKEGKRMENSIHKMRAAHLILSAILTMQGENAPAFSAHCNTIDNLCETVMSVFEKLGYRDRTVLGMRLGFDPHKGFAPTKVCKYLEIATAFEMTLASSASRLFHRICRRFAASMLEVGR